MNRLPKPKRGVTKYYYPEGGYDVYFDRMDSEGNLFVSDAPGRAPDRRFFWLKPNAVELKQKPRKAINKMSTSLAQQNKIYYAVGKVFLANHPKCQANCKGCKIYSTEIHHKRGRIGKLLTDIRFFLAVCERCHKWIENNPKAAKALGFSEDRT
jgi:hypothetical protein